MREYFRQVITIINFIILNITISYVIMYRTLEECIMAELEITSIYSLTSYGS